MSDSYRVTRIRIDTSALTRLMEVARAADIYDSRKEAADDNYETIVKLLCDLFEAEPAPLREEVSTKYGGRG